MSVRPTIEELQRALGGDVAGGGTELRCPGPGHSADDRSLVVHIEPNAPEGFYVKSFTDDDWRVCRDHVRSKLGLHGRPKVIDISARHRKSKTKSNWTPISEHIYRTAAGEHFLLVQKCRDENGRKHYPQSQWDGHQWITGKPKGGKIPYRLPELVASPLTATIFLCEGEKDADNVAKLGFLATTASEGAAAKWDNALTPHFKDRQVVILPDADAPGRKHGQKVAKAISAVAASVKVLDLYPDRTDGSDVSDWLADDSAGVRLAELAKEAPLWGPSADDDETAAVDDDELIAELATLTPLDYARRREEAADQLGIGVTVLDKVVRAQRTEIDNDADALPHWKVEPWADKVAGAELLNDIKREFEKYIVLPSGAADALSLWVLHAWTMDAGDVSPFLVLVSPTKRCGKTSVLIVLSYLTPRSELASNISASALFRYVEEKRPTLLIDEADSFLNGNEEMRGILNSGHTKAAAYVIRSVEVAGEHKPKRFSTWTPKAIAAIGDLADTLEDRAVVVQLQRKSRSAKVERLRKRDCAEFAILRRKAARWAADNFERLRDPDPKVPEALNDRAADNWRPLLAIAELAAGEWPRRGREAACQLSGEGHDASSINVELLADIRRAFGDEAALRSVDLVAKLVADPERPWVEWRSGKPLTPKQLGGLLGPFQITSETVSITGLADAKGYKRARFEELWEVYLPGQNTLSDLSPAILPSKRRNADVAGVSHDFRSVAEGSGDGSKNSNLSYSDKGSDASTFQKPKIGQKGIVTTPEQPVDDNPVPPLDAVGDDPKADCEAIVVVPAADAGGERAGVVEAAAPTDDLPDFLRRCEQCNALGDATSAVTEHKIHGERFWLHQQCADFRRRRPDLAAAHPSLTPSRPQ